MKGVRMTIWQWAVIGFLLFMADERLETYVRLILKTPRKVSVGQEQKVLSGILLFSLLFSAIFAFCGYLWNL